MRAELERRLTATLRGGPWADAGPRLAETLGGRDEVAACLARVDADVFAGLARAVASHAPAARFLGHRRGLAERLAKLDAGWVRRRTAELLEDDEPGDPDLETFVDDLRLLRHEDTLLLAALDLGGLCSFEEASTLLSALAEAIVRRATARACEHVPDAPDLGVVAMGKLGGREFTYHSDLDLIFLHGGDPLAIGPASRLAQRLIHLVSTMTGAGVAYAVDARLRPSGGKGMLVASFEGFASYQAHEAATWEHLALVRARAIAGATEASDAVLRRARREVFGRGNPWPDVADMRRRVEAERGQEARGLALKTGTGGLMDAEFLAQGSAVERGGDEVFPPSIPGLLAAVARRDVLAELTGAYGLLRRVEARARWIAGRGVEHLETAPEHLEAVAQLVEATMDGPALLEAIADARATLRRHFEAVCAAGTARILGDSPGTS